MSAWVKAACIIKTKHLQGELVVRKVDRFPFLLSEGMQVYFVPPTLCGPREGHVVSVSPAREGEWTVSFDTVDDIASAEELVGSWCLIAKSDVPEPSEGALPLLCEGWRVVDTKRGELGALSAIIEQPAQSLLSVEGSVEGRLGEILIPAVDEFICQIDTADRCITVQLPEGLLDLAAEGGTL